MTANLELYDVIESQDKKDKYLSWRKETSIANVFVCEQIAFILDEAQAALMRPGVVTCERALRRIAELSGEALPLAESMLSPLERDDTIDDIAEELCRKAKARKGWLKEATPVMKEMQARSVENGNRHI